MVASGNDFVIVDQKLSGNVSNLSKKICDRKFGIGADGLLLLVKSRKADIRMRIFNADGSEAEMCGNGARCTALYVGKSCKRIETKAGLIESKVKGDHVKIKLTNPGDLRLNIPIKIGNKEIKVNFINTGVPHVVVFVEGVEKIDAVNLGRQIRRHKKFAPAGTNVNFQVAVGLTGIPSRQFLTITGSNGFQGVG